MLVANPGAERVEALPFTTLPLASITNGVESGLAESSTNKALPEPVCVIRRALLVLFVLITVAPSSAIVTKLF